MIQDCLDKNLDLKRFILGPDSENFQFDSEFVHQMAEAMILHSKLVSLHEKMSEVNDSGWWSLFETLLQYCLGSNQPYQQPLQCAWQT